MIYIIRLLEFLVSLITTIEIYSGFQKFKFFAKLWDLKFLMNKLG